MRRKSLPSGRATKMLVNWGVTNGPGPGWVVSGHDVLAGSRSDENASHWPSGDHAGRKSPAGWLMTRRAAARFKVERPHVRLSAASRHKGQVLTIRREGALIVERTVVSKALEIRAVRSNPIEIGRTGSVRREDNPAPIGRQGRVVIERRIGRQRPSTRTIAGCDEDVRVARREGLERDLCSASRSPVRPRTRNSAGDDDGAARRRKRPMVMSSFEPVLQPTRIPVSTSTQAAVPSNLTFQPSS